MAESTLHVIEALDELEAFTVLTLRYLDGGCSAEEIRQLKGTLAASDSYGERFVAICRLRGELHEIYSSRRAALQGIQTRASSKQADAPVGIPQVDPCADTVMRDLSPEDTAHPAPKTSV